MWSSPAAHIRSDLSSLKRMAGHGESIHSGLNGVLERRWPLAEWEPVRHPTPPPPPQNELQPPASSLLPYASVPPRVNMASVTVAFISRELIPVLGGVLTANNGHQMHLAVHANLKRNILAKY